MDLSHTTAEERIKATLEYHIQELNDFSCNQGLELAIKLVKPDGWQHIAPAWLRLKPDLSEDTQLIPSLEDTTPIQRLTAAALYKRQVCKENEAKGLAIALKLAATDGWQYIAPHWLQLQPRHKSGGVRRPATPVNLTTKPVQTTLPKLENLTPTERILCASGNYEVGARHDYAQGLKYSLTLLLPDGWRHVAPAWADPLIQIDSLTAVQRIEALLASNLPLPNDFKLGLKYAAKLLQPSGWELLVPIWLLNSKVSHK